MPRPAQFRRPTGAIYRGHPCESARDGAQVRARAAACPSACRALEAPLQAEVEALRRENAKSPGNSKLFSNPGSGFRGAAT